MTATLDLTLTDRAPATAGRMVSAAMDFLSSLVCLQRLEVSCDRMLGSESLRDGLVSATRLTWL